MIFEQNASLRQRISGLTGREPSGKPRILEDTSEFMSINPGDVLRLGGSDYLVTGHAREGRFGIDEQPKFWVKKALDMTTGARKIIKLVFRETFTGRIGGRDFTCRRSPEKEAAVIQAMANHPNFMHGKAVQDSAGNIVRIIDFIFGPSLYVGLRREKMSHRQYFDTKFSKNMGLLMTAIEAIALLHEKGRHHGDIRADHIIIKREPDTFVWIDFDYEMGNLTHDVFCLGNVLAQVVGKGRHSLDDIRIQASAYPGFKNNLTQGDMSRMFRHRVINLGKLYPYIPPALNEILMRFSVDASDPYETAADLLADLGSLSL
jgi:hypothetical protein